MNYIQKNKQNIFIAVVALFLIAAMIALWIQQKNNFSSEDIIATITPQTVTVGDVVNYEDTTPFTKSIVWSFGDQTTSDKRKGTHIFQKEGLYNVSMVINNKYPKTFTVIVNPRPLKQDSVKATATIDAPIQARQFEKVDFKANSLTAREYLWKFGETGNYDSQERTPSYTYRKPGNYEVHLIVDGDVEHPVRHYITIVPSVQDLPEVKVASVDDILKNINDDFKYRLQQIANGENFNTHYNYLLDKYLCRKDNVPTTINDQKKESFYYYCQGLNFDKNNHIDEVVITYDNSQNCVIKVDVKQSK